MWLIILLIFIVVVTSIVNNKDNELAYSDLVAKIQSEDVKEIKISADGKTAEVSLKNENIVKRANIPRVNHLLDSLNSSMTEPSRSNRNVIAE